MNLRRYLTVSGLSLLCVGAATYLLYGVAVEGPHRWAVVMYVVGVAAALGGLYCDRGATFRDLVASLIAFLGRLLGPAGLADIETPIDALRARLDATEGRVQELEQKTATLTEQTQRDAERIAQLERELLKFKNSRARVVTGFVLEVLSIVLAAAASVLWAAGVV